MLPATRIHLQLNEHASRCHWAVLMLTTLLILLSGEGHAVGPLSHIWSDIDSWVIECTIEAISFDAIFLDRFNSYTVPFCGKKISQKWYK